MSIQNSRKGTFNEKNKETSSFKCIYIEISTGESQLSKHKLSEFCILTYQILLIIVEKIKN